METFCEPIYTERDMMQSMGFQPKGGVNLTLKQCFVAEDLTISSTVLYTL